MKTRIITAIICALIFIPFLVFSGTIAFPIILAVASALSVYEMLKFIGENNPVIRLVSCAIAAALPICARIYGNEQAFFNFTHKVFVLFLFMLFVVAVFSKGKKDVMNMAFVYVVVSFITNGYASIVLLRDYQFGEYIYMLVFICPWMTDIFAYFTGYFFGKHKLIPDVSPKKTIEGAIGGIVFSTLILVGYGYVMSTFVEELNANYLAFICVGIVLSIVSQCGDLIFSLIKRKYGVKDYGNLLPGHGGMLDRCDSVIASAPIVLFMFDLSGIFRLFI